MGYYKEKYYDEYIRWYMSQISIEEISEAKTKELECDNSSLTNI